MSSVPCRISSLGSRVDILPETTASRVECQGERYCWGRGRQCRSHRLNRVLNFQQLATVDLPPRAGQTLSVGPDPSAWTNVGVLGLTVVNRPGPAYPAAYRT